MSELIRKTESTHLGPWLIDKAALDALDEIIDDQTGRLEEHRKTQIDATVRREQARLRKSNTDDGPSDDKSGDIRKRVENDHPKVVRVITLTLSSRHKVRAESFREAVIDPNCREQKVTKIEVGLRCGDIRGDLAVPASDKNSALTIITLPEGSKQADELFAKLDMWAEQHKPGVLRWMQGTSPPIPIFITIALIMLISLIGLISGLIPTKDDWRVEVRKLVAKGVKPDDYGRALELLLRQSASLNNDVDLTQLPSWYKVAVVTTFVIGALYSLGVTTAFEIGKGASSVRLQNWYANVLWKAVFGFLLLGVLGAVFRTKLIELLWPK